MRAYALQMMCRTHLFSKKGGHTEVLSSGCWLCGAEQVPSAFDEFTDVWQPAGDRETVHIVQDSYCSF